MAHTARLLCFLLLSIIILNNVESKTRSTHRSISKRTSAPISHYPKQTSKLHSYPQSSGGSGGGRSVTSAPRAVYQRYEKPKTTLGTHSYPQSSGGSGGARQVTSAPQAYQPYQKPIATSGSHTYPQSPSGSGSVTTAPLPGYPAYPHPKPSSGSHTYPQSSGGSGGGRPVTIAPLPGYTPYPQSKPTSGPHSYPPSYGVSGGGSKPNLHPGIGVYPHNSNTGISSTNNFNTGHTSHSGYNSHVFVRNQQTKNIYTSNIRTKHIHHYHYNPPQQFYYSHNGNQRVYYPVYTGRLPDYVFEYRASRSRYSKLLAGLALYNLGLVSRTQQVQTYHNLYQPRMDEICQFGVSYNILRTEEMEIDCRLMTDFIWSESQNTQPGVVIGNQIYLPNGTLLTSYTQVSTPGVPNALDPRFNGDYVPVKYGMKCYIKWTVSWTYPRRKDVDCGLLQTYVDRSLNSATKLTSALLVIVISVTVLLFC